MTRKKREQEVTQQLPQAIIPDYNHAVCLGSTPCVQGEIASALGVSVKNKSDKTSAVSHNLFVIQLRMTVYTGEAQPCQKPTKERHLHIL